jgi:hypothetical protein
MRTQLLRTLLIASTALLLITQTAPRLTLS